MSNKKEILVKRIISSLDKMKSKRSNTDRTLQDISDYILLNKGDFQRTNTPGERREKRVFDSTAIQANEQLASILHSGLTDPTSRWFNLITRQPALKDNQDFKIWLNDVQEAIMMEFSRSTSGFQQQNHEFLLNLTGYGTAAMWVANDSEKGIVFNSRHLSEIFVTEDSKGFVDTVYRQFCFTARQAVQEWGLDKVGKTIMEAAEKDPHREFKFIHCVFPKRDYDKDIMDPKLDRFEHLSVYIAIDDKVLLDVQGFHEFPYLVARWEKLIGEVYGRSPSWNALSDILMLNLMSEVTIKAAQKQVDPPILMSDDGVVAPLQTFPGGVNIGAINDDGRPLMQPFITGGRLEVGLEMMEQRRDSIRAAYFVDRFAPREGVQPLTATETNDIRESRLRLIGPQIRRIEDEYLSPLVDRVFGILQRKGQLPPLPQSVMELGIEEVDFEVEYISPLAFTQRTNQLASYNRFFAAAGSFIQLQPETLDNLDSDFIVRNAAELSGIPLEGLKKEQEVAIERSQRAQQEQDAQLMGQVQAGAETAATLAKAGISPLPGGE